MAVLLGIVYYQYFNSAINHSVMNFLNSIKSLLSSNQGKSELSVDESKELNHAIVELMLEMVRADFVELHAEKQALALY